MTPADKAAPALRTHRRAWLALFALALLAVLAVVGWFTRPSAGVRNLDTTSNGATLALRSAERTELAPKMAALEPALEKISVAKFSQRVTPVSADPEDRVESPLRAERPTTLSIALLDELGTPLLKSLSPADRETVTALQLALLPTCPPVGEELTQDMLRTRILVTTNRQSDPWATLTVPEADGGCVCALIGDFAVAVAPLAGRQERVELRLRRVDLSLMRKTCDVQVVEAVSRLPVAGATVTFHSFPTFGVTVQATTDRNGWARAENVLVGPVRIDAERGGFLSASDQFTVRLNEPTTKHTLALAPAVTLSGRFRMLDGRNMRFPIAAIPVNGTAGQRTPVFTLDNGEFSIPRLHVGEYLLGISTIEIPAKKSIRRGEVGGWTYVDARNGDVQGIQVDITDETFARAGILEPLRDRTRR